MSLKVSIFWFRRDLRLEDNAGLFHALKSKHPVVPIFIFDSDILDKLKKPFDARVSFIHQQLLQLDQQLRQLGSGLQIYYGQPKKVWVEILKEFEIAEVFTNRDYEPYAQARDEQIKELLSKENIPFKSFKDHVIFEKKEVVKKDGLPYTVFTPYSKIWKAKLLNKAEKEGDLSSSFYLKSYPSKRYFKRFHSFISSPIPSLQSMGFENKDFTFPSKKISAKIIRNYGETRDFPAIEGTSKLGLHFRFGTISIREKARKAIALNKTYLNELIWRDFYAMILYNFPHVVDKPFRAKYEAIEWRTDMNDFQKWCDGQTGYPIVDAGMRELNATGYMHNRVRMIVASFLTKHLLLNYQLGEAYFAEKLLDFDLASNNGGWQWAAGCGTDAAPYFRIFNPYSQQEKFDKQWKYIKKWVPEYGTDAYVTPIIDHKLARARCLATYKAGLDRQG